MARVLFANQVSFKQGIDFVLKLCYSRNETELSASFEPYLDTLLLCDHNNQYHHDDAYNENGLLACFKLCDRIGPPHFERLQLKTCQLTEKLVVKHHLKLTDGGLNQLISHHLILCQNLFQESGFQKSASNYLEAVLTSLGSLLFENGARISQAHKDALLGSQSLTSASSNRASNFSQLSLDDLDGLLSPICSSSSPPSVRLPALKCLRNLTIKSSARGSVETPLSAFHATRCYDVFLHIILSPTSLAPVTPTVSPPPGGVDAVIAYAQRLLTAFQGIENCLLFNYDVHSENIGHLMAALKSFMFFGIKGSYSVPAGVDFSACLYPTPLSIPDAPLTMKEIGILPGKVTPSPNKKNRRRGKKNLKSKYAVATGDDIGNATGGGVVESAEKSFKPNSNQGGLNPNAPEFLPSGASSNNNNNSNPDAIYRHPNFSSSSQSSAAAFFAQRQMRLEPPSDSEFSDTEGGTLAKLRNASSFLRQQCHAALYSVIKCTERRIILGYWSALLPDRNAVSKTSPTTPLEKQDDFRCSFPSSTSPLETRNLLVAIMKDPSSKVRATAVAVVSYLLEGSKHYLAIADDHIGRGGGGGTGRGSLGGAVPSQMSFTPLSKTLAGTVHELHRSLLLALISETNHIALTQILKCIASLVVNVPYYKLTEGLLSKVVRKVRQFIDHKEVGVKIASLTCLGSVLCVQNVVDEIRSVLMEKTAKRTSESGGITATSPVEDDFEVEDMEKEATSTTATSSSTSTAATSASASTEPNISWLAEHCFSILSPVEKAYDEDDPIVSPLRIEALQLLGYMVRSHIPVLQTGLDKLVVIIKSGLTDKKTSLQLHSAKLLEELGRSLLTELELSSNQSSITSSSSSSSSPRRVSLAEVKDIWVSILGDAALVSALQNMNEPLIQAAACDALATIGSQVFQMLPLDKVILSMTIPLGLAQPEIEPVVRASAIRALGIFIQYPTLRENVNFISDVGQAVISCLDPSTSSATSTGQQGVRVKAAWAFGNLSESLYVNRETLGASFVNELDDRLLLNLLVSAISASYDTDKVRANAVRAVGNLLRYLPESRYQFEVFKETAAKSVYALIANISSGLMKVRWNSCYALGNMLRNVPLLISAIGSVWLEDMFAALCAAVQDCKNFKVRINAALALSVPKERGFFGDTDKFVRVWQSLCLGLQNAEIVTDFSEVKYREVLTDQICMTLVHLMNLVTEEDLSSPLLSSSINSHFESTLLPFFRQHGRRIANASQGDERKAEASEKIMAMANAETHLGLLKGGLKSKDEGKIEEEEGKIEEEEGEEEMKEVKREVAERTEDTSESKQTEDIPSFFTNHDKLKLVESLLALFSSSKVEDLDQMYADDLSFPSVNTALNFKQTFD